MSSKNKYAITFPPIYSRLTLVIIGFCVILNVMYTLFTPPPHIAMYGWFTAIVFIPFTWMLIMEKTYKIEVDGTRISVRRRLGLSRFSFDISDIVRVDAKTVDSGVGRLHNMTIHTSDGKKLNVDALLTNGSKLMKLIMDSVDESKIHKTYRPMKKKEEQ